jgi:hypothetical protein
MKLEKLLEKNPKEHVTLLAIGEVKTDVLQYLNKRNDLHIIKLETRYMKQRRKGLGLKVQVIKKLEYKVKIIFHSFTLLISISMGFN